MSTVVNGKVRAEAVEVTPAFAGKVLDGLRAGKSNKQLAAEFGMLEGTFIQKLNKMRKDSAEWEKNDPSGKYRDPFATIERKRGRGKKTDIGAIMEEAMKAINFVMPPVEEKSEVVEGETVVTA